MAAAASDAVEAIPTGRMTVTLDELPPLPAAERKEWLIKNAMKKVQLEDTPHTYEWMEFVTDGRHCTLEYSYSRSTDGTQHMTFTDVTPRGAPHMHRVAISLSAANIVTSQLYYCKNQFHHPTRPAVTFWYDDGSLERREYWSDGRLHCTNGPAKTCWLKSGIKRGEFWYLHDRLHRDNDEPAVTMFTHDGALFKQEWYTYGVPVRSKKYI
jgi:hypothetical protein